MGSGDSERVILDLDRGEPITGRISGEKGASASFRGWVELVGWIERLRRGGGPATHDPNNAREQDGGGHDARA
jgi:hypothetical protein